MKKLLGNRFYKLQYVVIRVQFYMMLRYFNVRWFSYEYRQFKPTQQKDVEFHQTDLYFYKEKSTGVGIKARFQGIAQQWPLSWVINGIELKILSNYSNIKKGQTVLQRWQKITSLTQFQVLNPKKMIPIIPNDEKAYQLQLQQAKKKHLSQICRLIISAFKNNAQIQDSQYTKNEDLQRWVEQDDNLIDVIVVEKNKFKLWESEEGFVRACPIFNQNRNYDQIYQTIAYQTFKQDMLMKRLQQKGIQIKQNISYPTFIQKIHHGLL